MKQYFYITIHFSPRYEESILLKESRNIYKNRQTGELYRRRLLYDFGWGQEYGFESIPSLSFDELIKLVEQPKVSQKRKLFCKFTDKQIQQNCIWFNNLYGAVAVIMQDYLDEFVFFLSNKVNTNYFSEPNIKENFKCFSFDTQKTIAEGRMPGGIGIKSYQDILNDCILWKTISSKIIEQIYN